MFVISSEEIIYACIYMYRQEFIILILLQKCAILLIHFYSLHVSTENKSVGYVSSLCCVAT